MCSKSNIIFWFVLADILAQCIGEESTIFPTNVTIPVNETLNGTFRLPEYYSYRYRIIGTFFQGVVLLVGVAGNIMVVSVVFHTQSMHSPTNCYLVSLAVADTIVLLAAVPQEILSYYLLGNQWVWGEAGCALFVFSQYLGINASTLSLVAFTVERYIAICRPMYAHTLCTVARAKRITMAVWWFAVLYCSPWLVLTTTRPLNYVGHPDVVACDFKLPRDYYTVYFFCDLIVFYVAPLILSCVLYGLIARVLFRRDVKPERNGGAVHHEGAGAARSQVVKMLAVVVVVFAILWLPYRGMLVYNSFSWLFSETKFMDLWFLMFAKTCVYINSAINPILYNAMSTNFRRAFHQSLTCKLAESVRRSTSAGSTRSTQLREKDEEPESIPMSKSQPPDVLQDAGQSQSP